MSNKDDFSREEAIKRYLILINEVALRIDLVVKACDGDLNLTPPFAREYAYLQYRRICELVALGCLLLHGDLPEAQTKKARRQWNAEKIMKLLQAKHPHAFPQSARMIKEGKVWNIKGNYNPEALTWEEFEKLYAECNYVLHRGSIRSVEQTSTFDEATYRKVVNWERKLVALLNTHIVAAANGRQCYFVSLRTPEGGPLCQFLTFTESGEVHVMKRNLVID